MSKLFENEIQKAQEENHTQSEEMEAIQRRNFGIARKQSTLPKGRFCYISKITYCKNMYEHKNTCVFVLNYNEDDEDDNQSRR